MKQFFSLAALECAGRLSHSVVLTVVLILLITDLSHAAENRWANRSSGKWENGGNWSLDIPPNINHDTVIAAAFGNVVTIDATSASLPNNMVVSSLRVGRPGNALVDTDTLSLSGAGSTPLSVLSSAVISNRGIVTITGSTLNIGSDFRVNGSLRLDSGARLNANGGMQLAGGNVTINSNAVLSPKGINTLLNDVAIDGGVTINGGALIFSNSAGGSRMVIGASGQGSLLMNSGELGVRGSSSLFVGLNAGSVGKLTIMGGTVDVEGDFFLGQEPGSTGSVLVAGGELRTKNVFLGRNGIVDPSGVAQITVSNGIWRVDDPFGMSVDPHSSILIAGGTNILSAFVSLDGTSTNTGARLLMTGGLLLMETNPVGIGGLATISNGIWKAKIVRVGDLLGGTGRVEIAGGFTSIAADLSIGSCISGGYEGAVSVHAGTLAVTNAGSNAVLAVQSGTLRIDGGTVILDTIDLRSSCARFERTGGTLTYRTALLDPARDDDGDGASNGLEQSKGFDPLDPADKVRDSDGDGVVDVVELLAGTDVFNSNSVVRIISVLPEGDNVRLRWKTVAGRTNVIQAVESIGGSNTFQDIATLVLSGTGDRTNTFIEPDAAKGSSRFYRVKVIP